MTVLLMCDWTMRKKNTICFYLCDMFHVGMLTFGQNIDFADRNGFSFCKCLIENHMLSHQEVTTCQESPK